jgi:predicted metal-dependent phosphoesterase TrpH
MSVGNLSRDEAARQIVRQYWQAIVEKDWDLLEKLHPAGSAKDWEQAFDVFRIYGVKELVEVGDPQNGYSCLGPAVP